MTTHATKAHGKARSGDPQTSFDAALHATAPGKLRASQARVLAMFKLYGDMTDTELLTYLHDAEEHAGFAKLMSPSGARTRRSELSKPNMDRLEEMAAAHGARFEDLAADLQFAYRDELRREGFRSPLWDTGARKVLNGRTMIVWGLAHV